MEQSQKEYLIVRETNEFSLSRQVNNNMKRGWIPLGGVSSVAISGGTILYMQAMVR